MIAALLFAAMSVQGGARTVEVSRGAVIRSADSTAGQFGYWDLSDTYIDATGPDDNFGGEPILAASSSKTILIRFGDLNRVLGSTRRIKKATLVLTIAGGDKIALKSVGRVLQPWSAGPYFTVGALINKAVVKSATDAKPVNEKPAPPIWSATWKHRLTGDNGGVWQQPGATGPQDVEPVKDATAAVGEKEVAIGGLAATFQWLADHPSDNYGLALQFQTECEFYSTRAVVGQPRLELQLDSSPASTGADLSVVSIQRTTQSGASPKEGEEIIYKAHVKNVGGAKAEPFRAEWILNGKPGAPIDVPDSLAPGTETILSTAKPYRSDKTDHRAQTIELRITPKGADAVTGNNALLVYENAKQIDVQVPAAVASTVGMNLVGSSSLEDWVQEQVRIFNDTYAGQSRFSFAPDGAKERVSVQHISVGTSPAKDGAFADGVATVPDDENTWLSSDPAFLRSIGLAMGLPNFSAMSFPAGKRILLKSNGVPVNRGSMDLYPGIAGYGDTRYEGGIPGQIGLMYEPYAAPNPGLTPLVPTGLLSATDVAVLNARVDHSDDLFAMPKTTLIKATNLTGVPLSDVQLEFFQSKDGQILDGAPTFTTTTSDTAGTALLPGRGNLGPFGKLEPDGGNGTFLIRATANGVAEWGWLKAWELLDSASRGNTSAGVLEVRFDLPAAPLDPSVNLAKDRIITDSTNLLPAKLQPLVSGGTDQDTTLGGKPGDWVEIDLGRDRTIGEIDLLGSAEDFWTQFDIFVYGTGQKPDEATPWVNELNWKWAASNRRDIVPGDPNIVSVAYRAPDIRIRFIRIVNRSSSVGKLRAIRVIPVKISP